MTNVWGLEGQTVRVGGQPRSSLVQSLREVGVRLNDHAEILLAHPAFEDPESQDLRFVERTVHQLGLPTGGTQSQVFVAARTHGFQLCPVIGGPFLRLATMDQPNAPDSVLSAGRAPTGKSPTEMGEAVRKSLDTGGSASRMGIRTAGDHEPTATELANLGPELGSCAIEFAFRPSSAAA